MIEHFPHIRRHRPETLFLVRLRPNACLTPRLSRRIVGVAAGVSLGIGSVFYAVGAWPVVGFMGADVLLVYLALHAAMHGNRAYEEIALTLQSLEFAHMDAGGHATEHYTLPSEWLSVVLEGRYPRNRLCLRTHGQTHEIGRYLSDDEKAHFAGMMRDALHARSHAPAPR